MLVGLPMARNIDLSYILGHQGGWVVIQEMKTVYTVLVDQWHSNGNKKRHFVKKKYTGNKVIYAPVNKS